MTTPSIFVSLGKELFSLDRREVFVLRHPKNNFSYLDYGVVTKLSYNDYFKGKWRLTSRSYLGRMAQMSTGCQNFGKKLFVNLADALKTLSNKPDVQLLHRYFDYIDEDGGVWGCISSRYDYEDNCFKYQLVCDDNTHVADFTNADFANKLRFISAVYR